MRHPYLSGVEGAAAEAPVAPPGRRRPRPKHKTASEVSRPQIDTVVGGRGRAEQVVARPVAAVAAPSPPGRHPVPRPEKMTLRRHARDAPSLLVAARVPRSGVVVPAVGPSFRVMGHPKPRPPRVAPDIREGPSPDSAVPAPRIAATPKMARAPTPLLGPRERARRRDKAADVRAAHKDRPGAAYKDRRDAPFEAETDAAEARAVEEPETVQVLKTGTGVVVMEAVGGGERDGRPRQGGASPGRAARPRRVRTATEGGVGTDGPSARLVVTAAEPKGANAALKLPVPPGGTCNYCRGTGGRRRPCSTGVGNSRAPTSSRSRSCTAQWTRAATTPP